MLKEKDKEIEHWKNGFERELEDNRKNTCELLKQDLVIRKKDKQIDLMAREIIMTKPINCTKTNEFSTKKIYMSKEEIKQYFERKVEEC